jgi:hypothetical protein
MEEQSLLEVLDLAYQVHFWNSHLPISNRRRRSYCLLLYYAISDVSSNILLCRLFDDTDYLDWELHGNKNLARDLMKLPKFMFESIL